MEEEVEVYRRERAWSQLGGSSKTASPHLLCFPDCLSSLPSVWWLHGHVWDDERHDWEHGMTLAPLSSWASVAATVPGIL